MFSLFCQNILVKFSKRRCMKYLDIYPECKGCPVALYCGTAVSSSKLCNSYDLNNKDNEQCTNSISEEGNQEVRH